MRSYWFFSTRKAGILRNGDFQAGNTGWLFTNSNFSVTAVGELTCSPAGSGGFFYQQPPQFITQMAPGNYRLLLTITDYEGGAVRAVFNNTAILDVQLSGLGLHQVDFTFAGGGDTTFNLQSLGFVGTISNVQIIRR